MLAAELRSARKRLCDQELLTLERKRQALNIHIEQHRETAEKYLPSQAMAHIPGHESGYLGDAWVDEDDNELRDVEAVNTELSRLTILASDSMVAEKKAIFLPSTIGHEQCKIMGLQNMVKRELALRQGEANDALEAIRIGIGEKSFRFRKQLRSSKSKVQKTRSWDAIHTVDRKLMQNCSIYKQARHAMTRLGATQAILGHYKRITLEDLQTNTAVQEPNARGQRNQELSWIWKMPGVSLTNQETLLHECEKLCPFSRFLA